MNRREFITMSSMTALASALGEDIKRKEPLRVAVVGLGRQGMDVVWQSLTTYPNATHERAI